MNFIPMELKFILVEMVLGETVLVGDPLYNVFQKILYPIVMGKTFKRGFIEKS